MSAKRFLKWQLSALMVLIWLGVAAAQSGAPYAIAPSNPYQSSIQQAQALVDSHRAVVKIPGMSVSVAVHGKIVWSQGFGFADVENRTMVTPLTKFRIGSVSKTLTASALALLYEQGKLDLDAPVQTYVPAFPTKRWPISTRQVAGHLAGIRHYRNLEFLMAKKFDSVTESLEIFKDDTLLLNPRLPTPILHTAGI